MHSLVFSVHRLKKVTPLLFRYFKGLHELLFSQLEVLFVFDYSEAAL